MIHRNAFCWCGSGKKWKNCHYPQEAGVSFQQQKKKYWDKYKIILKTEDEIEKITRACEITSDILEEVCRAVKPGVNTLELDQLARKLCKEYDVIPAALNYGHPPFPGSICISLNEVVCHGIPSKETVIKEGDILNVDVAVIKDGFFGDCSKMVAVGEVSEDSQLVMDVAYNSLMESIKILKPGVLVSDIGKVIESIAKPTGCSVVDQFVAHGVGIHFHENPQVPHCYNHIHIPLTAGMTFTIEPMINRGTVESPIDPKDGWTARTADGLPSAQYEHTILITESGHKILTTWKR